MPPEGQKNVFGQLIELAKRGNDISEQNVDYALSLCMEEKETALLELDESIICRTVMGKPIKPKTLGQKRYVDLIRDKMIVFGIGPAGTGKTYLAMAMAITALRNDEVIKLFSQDPPLKQEKILAFCREIYRAR